MLSLTRGRCSPETSRDLWNLVFLVGAGSGSRTGVGEGDQHLCLGYSFCHFCMLPSHLAMNLEAESQSCSSALSGSGFEKTSPIQLPLTHLKPDTTQQSQLTWDCTLNLPAFVSLSGHHLKSAGKVNDAIQVFYLAQGACYTKLERSQSTPRQDHRLH